MNVTIKVPIGIRVAVAVLLSLFPLLSRAEPAAAHPLGNFTVNHYSRIEVAPDRVRVRYVLDVAEIPTFQAMSQLDANGDGSVSDAEKNAFGATFAAQIAAKQTLTFDGARSPVRVASPEVQLLPGQAGLQTMRVGFWLEAPDARRVGGQAGSPGARIEYRDDYEPDRVGWREILVSAAGGVAIQGTGGAPVPTKDVSDELRTYPQDLLASPLDVRQVRFQVTTGTVTTGTASAATPDGVAGQRATRSPSISRASDGFSELMTRVATGTRSPLVILVALLTAVVLGGAHALSPGHGKTIVGAYLVGSRGTPKHALFLGLTVTGVHTAGVYTLGLAAFFASRYIVPERIFPWLSLLSGLLVFGVGASLVRSRWNGVSAARDDRHDHGDHDNHTDPSLTHSHGHGGHTHAGHTHAVPGGDGQPVTWRSLFALGVSGGLLPCPSALVVMLGSIALQQIGFGLVLIVAFSAGLAGTLIGIGLLMVYSGRVAGRLRLVERFGGASSRMALLVRFAPVGSAALVALLGLGLSYEAALNLQAPLALAAGALRGLAPLGLAGIVAGLAIAFALRAGNPNRSAPNAHAAHAYDHSHSHDAPERVSGLPHVYAPGQAPDHAHTHAHVLVHTHDHDHQDATDGRELIPAPVPRDATVVADGRAPAPELSN